MKFDKPEFNKEENSTNFLDLKITLTREKLKLICKERRPTSQLHYCQAQPTLDILHPTLYTAWSSGSLEYAALSLPLIQD